MWRAAVSLCGPGQSRVATSLNGNGAQLLTGRRVVDGEPAGTHAPRGVRAPGPGGLKFLLNQASEFASGTLTVVARPNVPFSTRSKLKSRPNRMVRTAFGDVQ